MSQPANPPPSSPVGSAVGVPPSLVVWSKLALALLLVFVAVGNCFSAFIYPLELEVREGTSWLYVLAHRAGVNIYDSAHAYINMNHGPVDPLLKNGVGTIFPFFGPMMITRIFVLLMPVALVLAMRGARPGRLLGALIAGLALEILLLGVWPLAYLQGRSDPCGIFVLALMLWAAGGSPGLPGARSPRPFLRLAATGLFGTLCVFTNWRFGPAVVSGAGALGLEILFRDALPLKWKALGRYLLVIVVASLVSIAVIFTFAYGTHWSLFYKTSIAFFGKTGDTAQAGRYSLFPLYIFRTHLALYCWGMAVAILAAVFPSPLLPRKIQLFVWWPILAALWISSSIAYWLNWNAGSVMYFGSFYVVAGFFLYRAVHWPGDVIPLLWRSEGTAGESPRPTNLYLAVTPGLQLIAVIGMFCSLPWSPDIRQGLRLTQAIAPAQEFLKEAKQVTAGGRIYSEDCYSFETKYSGEKIDMGDNVARLSRQGFFEPARQSVVTAEYASLKANPPIFIMTDGFSGPVISDLLGSYDSILQSPPQDLLSAPRLSLFRLKTAPQTPVVTGPVVPSGLYAKAVALLWRFPLISWLQNRNDGFAFVMERESMRLMIANRDVESLQKDLVGAQQAIVQTQQALIDTQKALQRSEAAKAK